MDSVVDLISLHFTYASAVRHYEVVYLIHEKHAEEVESINEKVQGEICFPFSWSFVPICTHQMSCRTDE